MAGKYINILLAGLLTILLFACSDDRDSLSGQASGDPLLTFNMTRAGGDIVSNTLVYLFDGQGSDAGKFNHKVQEVTYGPDRLSMTVAAGMWNIALVTANTDFSGGLIQPVRSAAEHREGHYLPCRNYARPILMGNRLLADKIIRLQELLYCHETWLW